MRGITSSLRNGGNLYKYAVNNTLVCSSGGKFQRTCGYWEPCFDGNRTRYSSSGNDGTGGRDRWAAGDKMSMAAAAIIASGGLALYWNYKESTVFAAEKVVKAGVWVDGLPEYTSSEVKKHTTRENRIWVTWKNGVYDVTDYLSQHPGGSKLLLAAGGSIKPFWMMYASHMSHETFALLESFRIGNIKEQKEDIAVAENDPYKNDPQRSPVLIPASSKPFNAEPPASLLTDNYLTPNDLFYVRNHLPVPSPDVKNYKVNVKVEGSKKSLDLNVDDLKRKFKKRTVTATLQCAGNRRGEQVKIKSVRGLTWNSAAIGNAKWSGASLDDVMKKAGIDLDTCQYKHIQFEGMDKGPDGAMYGASIPIELARKLKNVILLAYEMNDASLPADHGYPVRIIIPGVVGARNVKWLTGIILSNEESHSHWQRKDYKGFNSSVDWHNVDFTKAQSIQELPVVSAICEPIEGEQIDSDAEEVVVKGYAWSGGGRGIVRVDVTSDGGKTWHEADFTDDDDNKSIYDGWAWRLWTATVPVPKGHKGKFEIACKAVDASYNCQPDNVEPIWNLRGVLNNAWHRVNIRVN